MSPEEIAARKRFEVVLLCGGNESQWEPFRHHWKADSEGPYGMEFRFMGNLGMGGKFHKQGRREWISCYTENETPDNLRLITRCNGILTDLVADEVAAK